MAVGSTQQDKKKTIPKAPQAIFAFRQLLRLTVITKQIGKAGDQVHLNHRGDKFILNANS